MRKDGESEKEGRQEEGKRHQAEKELLRLSISRNLIRSCWGSYDSDGPRMGKMSFQ